MTDAVHEHRPRSARWTHIALQVEDIGASIRWYEAHTPLELLDRRADQDGEAAWLGHRDTTEHPFILVLASFVDPAAMWGADAKAVLHPFAHLGIEVPERSDVDAAAARGEAAGCLAMPPRQLPAPIGYVCMLRDPDGNLVEFSFDQGVYETARRVWGDGD